MTTRWLAVALLVGALASPADATPLDRFYLPSVVNRNLNAVAAGPDGRVWVALRGAIGAVDRDGVVTTYATGGLTPDAIAAGADGAVWFVAGGTVARVAGGVTETVARGLSDAESIAAGPDGAMWVAETSPGDVARVAADGSVQRFGLGRGVHAWSLTAGPDGNVWFAGGLGVEGVVGRVTPAGHVTTFKVPLLLTARAPVIVAGPDGNLWVASGLPNALFRVTPDGSISTIDVGDPPRALALAPDGALWFSTFNGLVRRAPSGALTRFEDAFGVASNCDDFAGPQPALAVAGDGSVWASYPEGALDRLAAGAAAKAPVRPVLPAGGTLRAPDAMVRATDGSAWMTMRRAMVRVTADGRRMVFHPWRGRRYVKLTAAADGGVWFSATGTTLASLSPSGRVRSYRLPRGALAGQLAAGKDGSVWYVDRGRHAIGHLSVTGKVREARLGRRAQPFGIASRPDGGVWVTDSDGAIERIGPGGRVTRFARRGTVDVPAIVTAPDGSAWYTDFSARRVGHVTATGKIHRFPTRGHPTAITFGQDGAVWFTTTASTVAQGGIGRIDAAGHAREFPVHLTCSASYGGLITGPNGNLWFALDGSRVAVAELDVRRLSEIGAL
jgi:virginiamycin B lyase